MNTALALDILSGGRCRDRIIRDNRSGRRECGRGPLFWTDVLSKLPRGFVGIIGVDAVNTLHVFPGTFALFRLLKSDVYAGHQHFSNGFDSRDHQRGLTRTEVRRDVGKGGQ